MRAIYPQRMGHLSEQQLEFLLQPGLTSRNGLWQLLEIYLTARRMTLEQFRRRHRLDRTFLKKLEAGTLPDTDPGVVKVRRIVGYGPDLRHRRKAIGVAMRAVEKATGITPSRLSRAERLLTELTQSEKRNIDRLLEEIEKNQQKQERVEDRRQLAALLRAARSESGLSQKELAEALGCERKAVVRWEKDGSVPSSRLPSLQSILPAFSPPDPTKGR